jgi:hypothetical protein
MNASTKCNDAFRFVFVSRIVLGEGTVRFFGNKRTGAHRRLCVVQRSSLKVLEVTFLNAPIRLLMLLQLHTKKLACVGPGETPRGGARSLTNEARVMK